MPSSRASSLRGYGAHKSTTLATGTSFATPVRGVMCNVAGTVTGRLEEDTADGDYILNAGQIYPLCFKSISSIGTATGRLLH